MIVYDKEQKQIVIPNGLGNVNIIINGGECPECPECPELTEISITENGRYEGAYNVVNVDVPTEGGGCNLGDLVKEITENGNYVYYPSNDGLDGYKMADIRINVPQEGGSCNLTSRTFTSNGVYHPEALQMRTIWFIADKPSAYDTGIKLVDDSWVEIYFSATEGGDVPTLIGCEEGDWNSTTFATRWYGEHLNVKIGNGNIDIPYTPGDGKLHKLKFGKTVGVWFDDVKVSDIEGQDWVPTDRTIYIGAMNDPSNNNENGFWRPWVGYIGDVTIYGSLNENVAEYHFKAGDYGRWGEFKRVEDDTNLPNLGGDDMAYAQTMSYGEAPDGYNEITVNVPQYNLGTLDWTLTSPSTEVKNASDDGYDGYSQVTIRPENIIAQEKENAINDFKNKMKEITITENGTYSIDDQETKPYIEFDGNSYFDSNIPFGENTKIEVAILKTTYEEDEQFIGCANYDLPTANTYGGFGIVLGAGLAYGVFGKTKTTNIPFSMEEEQILTLDRNGIHSSFGNRTEGWIDDSKLNSNAYGQTIGIGKIKSTIDGWMYRGLNGRIGYVKIWTNKDDDSTMTLFRPKNMTQGAFGVVNSEGIETGQIENLGSGTATFVEENVKKYPYGFKRVEVNVPDLNGSYDEGYKQGQADVATNARVLDVTENGVYKSKFSDPIVPDTVTGVYADGTNFYSYAELSNKIFNTKIAGSADSRLEFWYKGDNKKNTNNDNVIIGAGNRDGNETFQVRYNAILNNVLKIYIGANLIIITNWNDRVWHHLIVSKAEGIWIDGEKKGDFSTSHSIDGEFFINGIGYRADGKSSANGTFGMIKIDDVVIIPTADGFLNTNTGELLEVVNDGGYTYTENLPIYAEGELYKTINVNVVPQISIKEEGLNVWYNDLTRITDENEQINSDWGQALQGETIQNVFPGIAMTISGQAVAKPFFIDKVNGNSTAIRIGKLVSNANGTPISCAVVIIGAFDCKNIQTVDLEAFKHMTDLCFIDGMKGLGESFTSPQTIDFTYCTNLFIKTNSKKYISNFAESLFNLSAGNKNSINTSTLKFKSAVQERGENADAIALMRSKGWTVEFV